MAQFLDDAKLNFEDQLVLYCAMMNDENPIHYTKYKGKQPKKTFDEFTEYLYYFKK